MGIIGDMPKPKSEVFCMDCLAYMKTIPDKHFDLAICDPPYQLKKSSVQGSGKLKTRTLNKHDMSWDIAPPPEYWQELFRISKNQIVWGGNYFDLPPTRCFICWDKVQPWENFSQVEYAWTSFDSPAQLFRFDNRTGNKIHPTQKPVELYAWLLRKYAKPGDRIFATMIGSGSSRIAAYKMGFDFVGCELDKEYFDKGCERFNRECKGEYVTLSGRKVKELTLFDE